MTTVLLTACGGGSESELAAQAAKIGTASTLESAEAISPSSAGTWTKVSGEWSYFTLTGSQYVRFGAGSNWVGKYVSGSAQCVSDTFGSDPAPGVTKECDVYSDPVSAPTPAPAPTPTPSPSPSPAPATSGTALLNWSAPAGSVAGYRVYYGTSSHAYNQVKGSGLYVTNTTYTVPSLPGGHTYYFAVTAVDAAGRESAYSAEATKAIP